MPFLWPFWDFDLLFSFSYKFGKRPILSDSFSFSCRLLSLAGVDEVHRSSLWVHVCLGSCCECGWDHYSNDCCRPLHRSPTRHVLQWYLHVCGRGGQLSRSGAFRIYHPQSQLENGVHHCCYYCWSSVRYDTSVL